MFPVEQQEFMSLPIMDRRNIIRQEVNARIKKDHGFSYLNNFYTQLPDGLTRKTCERLKIMDTIYGDFVSAHGGTQTQDEASDMKWGQTLKHFFTTIDETIAKMGIPIDQLLTLQANLNESIIKHSVNPSSRQVESDMKILNKIYRLTLPLFIELRAMGYTRQDLAG